MKRYEITEQNIDEAIALRDKGYSNYALIAYLGISNIADDCLLKLTKFSIWRHNTGGPPRTRSLGH